MKVKSMRGEVIDVARFIAMDPTKKALGNANMNARGDIVSASGEVVKPREVMMREYHKANPKAVKRVGINSITSQVLTPSEAIAAARQDAAKTPAEPAKRHRKITDSD